MSAASVAVAAGTTELGWPRPSSVARIQTGLHQLLLLLLHLWVTAGLRSLQQKVLLQLQPYRLPVPVQLPVKQLWEGSQSGLQQLPQLLLLLQEQVLQAPLPLLLRVLQLPLLH